MLHNGNCSITDPITEKRVAHTMGHGQCGAGNTTDFVFFDKKLMETIHGAFPVGFWLLHNWRTTSYITKIPLCFLSLSWMNKIFLRYWDISLVTITHCANTQWAICYTTIQPPTKVSHKNAHHLWWIKSRIVKVKLVARKEKLTNFEFNNFIVYYKNGPLLGNFYSRLIRDGP